MTTTLTPRAGERFAELLPWYVNGTMGGSLRAETAALIQASPACRKEFEKLLVISDVIRGDAPEFDEADSLARIGAGLRAVEGRTGYARASTLRWFAPRIALAIAAAAVAFQVSLAFL